MARESDSELSSDEETPRRLTQSKKPKLPKDYMDVKQRIEGLSLETNDSDDTWDKQDPDLAKIKDDYTPEESVSEPTGKQLAAIVHTMSQGKLPDAKVREKLAQCQHPEDIKMKVPRVKLEIRGPENSKSAEAAHYSHI